MCIPNYKRCVQEMISQSDVSQYVYDNSVVYNELSIWLKKNQIRLESEMFKAVLFASRIAAKNYIENNIEMTPSMAGNAAMSFHGRDGEHLKVSQVRKYTKDFLPILKKRLDKERKAAKKNIPTYKVNIVRLGELFDEIVELTDAKEEIAALLDMFIKNDVEELI